MSVDQASLEDSLKSATLAATSSAAPFKEALADVGGGVDCKGGTNSTTLAAVTVVDVAAAVALLAKVVNEGAITECIIDVCSPWPLCVCVGYQYLLLLLRNTYVQLLRTRTCVQLCRINTLHAKASFWGGACVDFK